MIKQIIFKISDVKQSFIQALINNFETKLHKYKILEIANRDIKGTYYYQILVFNLELTKLKLALCEMFGGGNGKK